MAMLLSTGAISGAELKVQMARVFEALGIPPDAMDGVADADFVSALRTVLDAKLGPGETEDAAAQADPRSDEPLPDDSAFNMMLANLRRTVQRQRRLNNPQQRKRRTDAEVAASLKARGIDPKFMPVVGR